MKKIKWFVFTFLLLGFGVLAYFVLTGQTVGFDDFIYGLVTLGKCDFVTSFFKFITFFASEIAIILVSLIVFLKNRNFGVAVLINTLFILILNISLKLIFMRERPLELMIITEDGYSFPSGHAMAALGFYGFIIYLICTSNSKKFIKIVFSILLGLLIFLIGVSRIYLGVHYASDVLAGFLISGAYLILYVTVFKKILKRGVK